MGGLPRMGVEGSGLASCISSYMGMLMIIAWSFQPKLADYRFYHWSKLSGRVMKEIGRLSLPSGVAVLVDRSDGTVDFGVPTFSLIRMHVETFPPDQLPPDLAGVPAVRPGSK